MTVTITPTNATLGCIVTDVHLGDMSDAEWRNVEDAFHEHGVLICPQQHLTRDEQVAFSRRFGNIENLSGSPKFDAVQISNEKEDGTAAPATEHRTQILRGNEGWHTDSSYMPLAAKASCLTAMKLPETGGGTAWADMRAAYEALDDDMKAKIANLEACHSLYYSQSQIGHIVDTGMGYGFHTKGAPVRPLVKTHPVTKRKSLFIGRHAYRIFGMADDEAQQLLQDLVEFACQPPRIYEHDWQVGDLCIWDNRCVLHRARPYKYDEIRVLRHTRIAGEPATELVRTIRDELASGFEQAAAG
ncbi:MAG: TauD/TfdA family dioxygenase [Gammaproteobacteria bacterium]|nr:TauD/TfdA family dioxygenase [Gammaproteobacteria bacterium]